MVRPERIEIRVSGTILGVIDRGAQQMEIKKGDKMYMIDLVAALVGGSALIIERVLHPEGDGEIAEAPLAHSA